LQKLIDDVNALSVMKDEVLIGERFEAHV
jgi:hypothetical protein